MDEKDDIRLLTRVLNRRRFLQGLGLGAAPAALLPGQGVEAKGKSSPTPTSSPRATSTPAGTATPTSTSAPTATAVNTPSPTLTSTAGHPLPAGYLHTQGAHIVDVNNNPVRLARVNWYGFDCNSYVAGGLDHQPLSYICQQVKNLHADRYYPTKVK